MSAIEVEARYSPLRLADVERHAKALRSFLALLDREVVEAALLGKGESDFLESEREEVHSGCEFPHVVVPVFPQGQSFIECSLAIANSGIDHFFSRGGHCSSPVVADAERAGSVDPALTVQEDADIPSPGVGVAGACHCAPADSSSEKENPGGNRGSDRK